MEIGARGNLQSGLDHRSGRDVPRGVLSCFSTPTAEAGTYPGGFTELIITWPGTSSLREEALHSTELTGRRRIPAVDRDFELLNGEGSVYIQ